jgi:hypothetical protein
MADMGMDKRQLKEILDGGENLQVEFKGDLKCLSDRDLLAAVVALANTEGGTTNNTLKKLHNKLRPAGTPIWEH